MGKNIQTTRLCQTGLLHSSLQQASSHGENQKSRMTNTIILNNRRNYYSSSSSSSSSEVSQVDTTVDKDNQASSSSSSSSSSVYSAIRRKFRRWKWIRPPQSSHSFWQDLGLEKKPNIFSYVELRKATGNFRPENKIGEGGYGSVYKGTLSDGKQIAVKRHSDASKQGKREFLTEISILSAVQHCNLVKLYGCCIEKATRLLVYEYLENKSLDQALFGNKKLCLDWKTRFNICLGVARGLTYLHEDSKPKIVHRDVKASNILLDFDLNPKISDFGLAKLNDDENTHISTRVAGTMGYIAPEYALRGYLTEKADVFGFGVMALEILCGRSHTDTSLDPERIYLLEWAWNLYKNNRGLELLDPRMSEFNNDEATRLLGISMLCTQASSSMRPPMSRVVAMLSGDIDVSPVTEKPSYLTDDLEVSGMTTSDSEDGSSGSPQAVPLRVNGVNSLLTTFSYAELSTATENFNSANKLGQGGFGPVYKGTLADEREIAVKKLLVSSPQGESQFVAEISAISAVQHRNLVKLYGYCSEEENKLLVYEYLVNKSLDLALFGKNGLHLDWTTRFNICLGAAKGLAYFHDESTPRIVHRDVKASNILLDINMNPKISDLGLARLFDDTKAHMTTRVGGTIGYLAPEYAMRGFLTEKADVYGFGIVAMETLCGRPVIDSRLEPGKAYLLEWAWRLYEKKQSLELVDPRLTEFNKEEAIRVLSIALLCTQASPNSRPPMSQVVAMLTGEVKVKRITERPSYLGW